MLNYFEWKWNGIIHIIFAKVEYHRHVKSSLVESYTQWITWLRLRSTGNVTTSASGPRWLCVNGTLVQWHVLIHVEHKCMDTIISKFHSDIVTPIWVNGIGHVWFRHDLCPIRRQAIRDTSLIFPWNLALFPPTLCWQIGLYYHHRW